MSQEEISNIVTSPVLDGGVIREHASPNPTLQIHPIWAIRAYSSSKSMGQEHRQQSSQSMGSNNSSKRIGKNIGGSSSSSSKSMGSSSIRQEQHWTRGALDKMSSSEQQEQQWHQQQQEQQGQQHEQHEQHQQ